MQFKCISLGYKYFCTCYQLLPVYTNNGKKVELWLKCLYQCVCDGRRVKTAPNENPQEQHCLQRTYIGISRKRLKYTYLLARLEFSNSSAPCTSNIIIQRFAAGVTVHTR